jgi:hypothetical protein
LTDAPPSGYARGVRVVLVGLLVLGLADGAQADELERLREENARLRARVQALEAENARLRDASDVAPLAAALRESAAEAVRTDVDADGTTTRIATEPSRLESSAGPRARHWVVLRTRQPGSDGAELVIEALASRGAYREVRALELGVDGTREALAVAKYETEDMSPVRGGAPTLRETVVLAVPPATLARMAAAHTVDGTLGPLRFRLTPQQLATVRAFAERMAARR